MFTERKNWCGISRQSNTQQDTVHLSLCHGDWKSVSGAYVSIFTTLYACGRIKCLNFLSWWWWEYCTRSLRNTCSFFGSTYVKSFRQGICSRNLKIGQCVGNTFFVNWMCGCLVLLALSMSERSQKIQKDKARSPHCLSWCLYRCTSLSLGDHILPSSVADSPPRLYLVSWGDRFLRKSWVYICGGQYCSSPTILIAWSTSEKTVSLFSHLDNFHLSLLLWTT